MQFLDVHIHVLFCSIRSSRSRLGITPSFPASGLGGLFPELALLAYSLKFLYSGFLYQTSHPGKCMITPDNRYVSDIDRPLVLILRSRRNKTIEGDQGFVGVKKKSWGFGGRPSFVSGQSIQVPKTYPFKEVHRPLLFLQTCPSAKCAPCTDNSRSAGLLGWLVQPARQSADSTVLLTLLRFNDFDHTTGILET